MTARPHIELTRTLDEKFLISDAVFHTAQPTGTVLFSDDGLRAPDGTLDVAAIHALLSHGPIRLPAMRLRLRWTPLSLTTPAWVPVPSVDLDWHVTVDDQPPADPATVVAGGSNRTLDVNIPMWSAHVQDLGEHTVALTLRINHALGDGMFGLRVLDAFTTPERVDGPPSTAVLPEMAAPRTGLGILLAAGSTWWATFRPLPSAWHEYWRKPFTRRVRRWVGRGRRHVRGIPSAAPLVGGLPLHHGFALCDFRTVRATAKQVGASVHDLLVGATLHALLAEQGEGDVSLDVPVSRRTRGTTTGERNHISMGRVHGVGGSTLPEVLTTVRSEVAAAVEGDAQDRPGSTPRGYASYLPWSVRRRWFGTAASTAVVLWPVLAPEHEVAVFGSSHAGQLALAVSGRSPELVASVLRAVADTVSAGWEVQA